MGIVIGAVFRLFFPQLSFEPCFCWQLCLWFPSGKKSVFLWQLGVNIFTMCVCTPVNISILLSLLSSSHGHYHASSPEVEEQLNKWKYPDSEEAKFQPKTQPNSDHFTEVEIRAVLFRYCNRQS